MRIHRLEIQAFGPFAERQHIDFDALAEQGLFLLNGPTGAGKSSVLDAICYALYGSVPGARQNARRLRSDHAPVGLAPEVVCEFSAGSRRLEVTRNPSWNRPSRRGSGTTTEQAKTMLRERVAGEWVTRSTRNDEAGAELQALLGMNREQFTRVVMLPQGEFAAFLRSDAAARGELLQRLFATDRFSGVEQMLAERAAHASTRAQEVESELEDLLSRAVEEVERHGLSDDPLSGGPLSENLLSAGPRRSSDEHASAAGPTGNTEKPGSTDRPGSTDQSGPTDRPGSTDQSLDARGTGDGSAPGDAEADPASALAALQDRLTNAVVAGRNRARELTAVRDNAAKRRSRLETERRDRLAFRRLAAEAAENQIALAEAGALRELLENHRRAQILQGPLQTRDEAADQARSTRDEVHSLNGQLQADPAARQEIPDLLTSDVEVSGDAFDSAHQALRERLAEARAALPTEEDLVRLQDRIRITVQRSEENTAELDRYSTRQQQLEEELSDLSARIETTEAAGARAAELASACAETAAQLDLLAQADRAERSLRELDERQDSQRALFLAAKEDWLQKLQLRLEQTAAELAARLSPGEPCPVCGSQEHPAPATAGTQGLVTREDEESARAHQDEAERSFRDTTAVRDAAALQAAGLRARSGDTPAGTVRAALASLEEERGEAEAAVRASAELLARKAAAKAALAGVREQQAEAVRSEAEFSSLLSALEEQHTALLARLESVRGRYATVAEKVAQLEGTAQRVGAVCAALSAWQQAAARLEKAEQALALQLAATEFASPDTVRQALLDDSQVEAMEQRIREAEHAAHRIERDLERPENVAAAASEKNGEPIPEEDEIAAAARAEESARVQLERAVLEVGLLEQSVVQMGSYADRVAALDERLVPLRQAYRLARSVADTVRGNGENLYRMSLATYVLAARLEQVAEAATERLQHMSDGRYSLVHSDSRSGNRKSGLGLNVIDSWTGRRRDTATLSGGESFMASLALALGLADVVQQESGGLDIETLFVDEGFGSLDEQSLEQVMDALENLRDGGRVVGLVSHVAELKQRIPAQLHVSKGRTGSSVRFVNQLERV
ncbi:SMC family ATPase [Arthrobacter sp. 35/47]|uniref:AAA family ATPase n=1 Tax=Arthrobacter sp. 35/47 TaxID=269454 RepID=UPI00047C4607|nr:SMC family ATPase [Arthrobacter sp. 35/47]